jgi:hypothetical protein
VEEATLFDFFPASKKIYCQISDFVQNNMWQIGVTINTDNNIIDDNGDLLYMHVERVFARDIISFFRLSAPTHGDFLITVEFVNSLKPLLK